MTVNKELEVVLEVVKKASIEVMKIYNDGNLGVEIKEDNSPVTKADKLADSLIREHLHKNFPFYAFLTEESSDDLSRLSNDYVWIIDPIDGTKDFIAHDGDFSINVGLAYKHEPVLGVIMTPADNIIYYAVKGKGAYKIDANGNVKQIHVSNRTKDLIGLVSHFHTRDEDWEFYKKNAAQIPSIITSGSSKKGCLIAEGVADVCYRTTHNTKEWDTCAMHIIITEAGGYFSDIDGNSISYNREDVYNRNGYVICNKKENFISFK